MKDTGVFATKDEIENLKKMMRHPVMYLSGGHRMGGDPIKQCHAYALQHGLPEIVGYYGIKNDGEFVEE